MEEENNTELIQIRFVTKQKQYAVADHPLAVPITIANEGLNKLVNSLLTESENGETKTIDFEFLIEGEILRTSLSEYLQSKLQSTENVFELEYVKRLSAPKPEDCLLHDDWVSSVHSRDGLILSGSYDGSTHIWNNKGKALVNLDNNVGAIKSVAWVSLTDDEGTFLAGGQDQTTVLWHWTIDSNSTTSLMLYRGHERSVESLGVNPEGSMFASVGWDTLLKVWSVSMSSEPPAKKSKKEFNSGVLSAAPEMTLKGHRDCVSCVRWSSKSELVTCSWDETLRIWDVEEAGMKQEMTGNKAFMSCDLSSLNGLILTSSADKHVRLYDPRSTEGSVVKQTFTSHQSWVQSVRWCPTEDYLFMSGGHDHIVKLWDTRSPRAPLYDLAGHTEKVLCCDWSDRARMVSGGADSAVRIFTAPVQ